VSPSGDDFDDINDEGEPPSILYETCPHIRNSSCRPYRALSSLSRKGDEYVLVAIWDNYIHYEPMPSRTSAAYIQTYTAMIAVFKSVGRKPTFWRLDNETADALVHFLESNGCGKLRPVPPGTHRANKAERAIRSGKNHFQATLATTPPSFPLELWDELLQQAEITINQSINHLRRYGPDPTKCAYEGGHGHRYDFVAHPLAVCGMHVLVHDKPAPRPSWSPHGARGCYLGPALLHHKCWRTWIIDTRSERISDTLAWFPDPFKLPGPDPHAMVAASLDDLTVALSHLPAPNTLAPDQRRTIQDRAAAATSDLRAILDVCNHVSTHNASPTAALLCGE
jgi:hypothetical protein